MAKYKALAGQIEEQIARGVWIAHEKLPSLRQQSRQSGYSLMTVMHAYQLLESQGLIQAQERSGYVVVASPAEPSGPSLSKPTLHTTEAVSVNDFVFEVLQACRDPQMLSLGFAYPDPALYPRYHLSHFNKSINQTSSRYAFDNLPPGNLKLRKIIAKRYAARGVTLCPGEIVITAGALEALSLSLQASTSPGDWVVIESPCFYGVMQTLERLGLKAISVNTCVENGLDIVALERAFQKQSVKACCLMSSYQNPVGTSLNNSQKQQVASLIDKYNVALIEDDVYAELYCTKTPPLPVTHFVKKAPYMLCSSFSKSLVAGYRIGWVAAGNHAVAIQKQQVMSTLATSAPVQLALADYLTTKNYESHLKVLRRTLAERKHATWSFLNDALLGVATVFNHNGGYFLWVVCQPHVDAMLIYHEALRLKITIAPGKLFSLSNDFNHCFRVNASFELSGENRHQLSKLMQFIVALS